VIFNTEVFEVSDPTRFKEIMLTFTESVESGGGSDVRIFRNVDNPNQVFTSMWWETAEQCRNWAANYGEDAFKKLGEATKSADPEFLWEEY
jgi:heme-degrading monooxygenase HmoA